MNAIRHKTKLQACLSAGAVLALVILFGLFAAIAGAAENTAAAHFHDRIEPILETYCYSCHAYDAHEGGPAFDEYKSDGELVGDVKTWLAVLKNVRSNVMPPPDEARLTDAERRELFAWIEQDVFKFNPADPDPGRVTL